MNVTVKKEDVVAAAHLSFASERVPFVQTAFSGKMYILSVFRLDSSCFLCYNE